MLERRVAADDLSDGLVSRAREIAAEIGAGNRLERDEIEVHAIACSGLGAQGRDMSDA
jgi:thiamine monophosphate kinase